MSYTKERVKGGKILDFHVRGPSAPSKENHMCENTTMAFFMHKSKDYNTVYCWPDPKKKKEVGKISKRVKSEFFEVLDDNHIFISEVVKDKHMDCDVWHFKKIEISRQPFELVLGEVQNFKFRERIDGIWQHPEQVGEEI